ncbi:type II toxin-antitoxin system HipA family toxin [Undibacterium sp. Xuan67W]|uniref:type II toxin-antitoxin system HipA family toxin n=1 Tax=Undibacterium sp. Xuan67W TaxID=3413057 RepID=UPI003BEF4F84
MIFRALDIFIGEQIVGVLYQYGDIIRLQVDNDYASNPNRPLLSISLQAKDPKQEASLLLNPSTPMLNSTGEGRLPNFFQNLLPEGVLRKHIALERHCAENDYFDLLAACGKDLPGNVRAAPSAMSRAFTTSVVTQNLDALEESVVDEPLADAVSLSGMQPKLALALDGGRYVARQRMEGAHIIGKLPTNLYEYLPEVEHLSLQLARVAGVTVCNTTLQPMHLLIADHQYELGKTQNFLAVQRFDRDRPGRLHAEDFAQILNVQPQNKYTGGSYADIARVMMAVNGLGEPAVLELIRRITVSELIGNYDFHLKNIGVLHFPDGRIELSPAYDIVAYSVYIKGKGHALKLTSKLGRGESLTPAAIRQFSNEVGILETKVRQTIKEVCSAAFEEWADVIDASSVSNEQKTRLKRYVDESVLINGLNKRAKKMILPGR